MKRLYLDMNIYNRPFDDQSQVKIKLETIAIFSVFQRIKKGQFVLLWSFILDFENSLNPYEDIKMEIEMASSLASEKVDIDEDILHRAKEFETKGIKPRDALHLACAVEGKADYFLTCDDKFIKRSKEIEYDILIKNPIDFVKGLEVE